MCQFIDALKVAKFISRYLKKDTIDIEAIEIAHCFFKPNSLLDNLLVAARSNFVVANPHNLDEYPVLGFGQAILDSYEALPSVNLDASADALRKALTGQAAGDLVSVFPTNQRTNSFQIECLRKLPVEPNDILRLYPDRASKEQAKNFLSDLELDISKAVQFVRSSTKRETPLATVAGPSTITKTVSRQPVRTTQDITMLRTRLAHNVLDQPLAIKQLCEEIQARDLGLVADDQPMIFTLVGPPASGKTLTCNTLADGLWKRPYIVLNMATFSSANEGFGLTGVRYEGMWASRPIAANEGFGLTGVRYGYDCAGAGRLTSFVFENSNALVVLDRIDLAHPRVQNLLIPLFTEGALNDEYGFDGQADKGRPKTRKVSFKNAVVLFTTNACEEVCERADFSKLYEEQPQNFIALIRNELSRATNTLSKRNPSSSKDDESVASGLGSYLGLSRILPFRNLGLPALTKITLNNLKSLRDRLAEHKVNVQLLQPDAIALALTLSQGPEINATELASSAMRGVLAAYIQNIDRNSIDPSKTLSITVADEAGVLASLQAQAPAKLLHNMLRRSETLVFDISAIRAGSDLTLELRNFSMARVPVSTDYDRDGGMTIDLPTQKFADVFGHTHIKGRLSEVVRLLKQPADAAGNAIALPKGMLLHGQPGTGKTMLAKALAAEADLPFIATTGPQLLDKELISTVFKRARKFAPCLVFIDEIDALGVRGAGGVDVCINQLLTEIDGFTESRDGGVFVIAATNYRSKVDPALTRSGRLDLCLEVPMLDREARGHFIDKLKQLPHADVWNAELLVELSAGMTGADLEKLCREATLDLIRRPRANITQAELLEQLNVIKHGARVENPPLREQLAATAYHEAGHAVVSMVLNPDIRIEQVTIVPRGNALGFTAYSAESMENRHFNRNEVMNLMCVALAGRVAEAKQFPADGNAGGEDAGAASDLAQATSLAWRAVTQWGLDNEFGWACMTPFEGNMPAVWREQAVTRVNRWIDDCKLITGKVVTDNWNLIEKLAARLLVNEMADEASLRAIVQKK
jgi:cell division protease FtsH